MTGNMLEIKNLTVGYGAIPALHGISLSVKTGTPVVTVVGHPGELVMWALGRTTAAQVRLDGADQAVEALNKTHWRL